MGTRKIHNSFYDADEEMYDEAMAEYVKGWPDIPEEGESGLFPASEQLKSKPKQKNGGRRRLQDKQGVRPQNKLALPGRLPPA